MASSPEDWIIVVRDAQTHLIKFALGTEAKTITYHRYDGSFSTRLLNVEEGDYESIVFRFQPARGVNVNSIGGTLQIRDTRIGARDIVEVASTGYVDETLLSSNPFSSENESEYYPRFVGRVMLGTNRYNPDNRTFDVELEGIYRDADQTVDSNDQYAAGVDVGSVASQVISGWGNSGSISTNTDEIDTSIGVDTPTDTSTRYAHMWREKDAKTVIGSLAARVRNAGTELKVGVNPYRLFYFLQPDDRQVRFAEEEDGVEVSWLEPQASQIVTAVRWIIGEGDFPFSLWAEDEAIDTETPDLITHTSESGITQFGRREISLSPDSIDNLFVQLHDEGEYRIFCSKTLGAINEDGTEAQAVIAGSGPFATGDYTSSGISITQGPSSTIPSGTPLGFGNGAIFYLSQDLDPGDSDMFGTLYDKQIGSGGSGYRIDYFFDGNTSTGVIVGEDFTAGYKVIAKDGTGDDVTPIRRFSYYLNEWKDAPDEADATSLSVGTAALYDNDDSSQVLRLLVLKGAEEGGKSSQPIPTANSGVESFQGEAIVGDRAGQDNANSKFPQSTEARLSGRITIKGTGSNCRFIARDMRIWRINTEGLDAAAEDEYRIPVPGTVEVQTYGRAPDLGNRLTVRRRGEANASALFRDLPIEMTEVEIRPEVGVMVRYRTGERYNPEAVRRAGLIGEDDRRASLSGARARFRQGVAGRG